MGSDLDPKGESDQVAEEPQVGSGDGYAEDDQNATTSPVIDLTEPTPTPQRFFANLADL